MSKTTGGKAYFAGNWREEQKAFASIREDLAHLYTIITIRSRTRTAAGAISGKARRQRHAEVPHPHPRWIQADSRRNANNLWATTSKREPTLEQNSPEPKVRQRFVQAKVQTSL